MNLTSWIYLTLKIFQQNIGILPFGKLLYVCASALLVIALCISVLVLFPNIFVNGYLKSKIELALQKAYPQHEVQIAAVRISILDNVLEIDSVKLTPKDTLFALEVAQISISEIDWLQIIWSGDVHTSSLGNTAATAQNILLTSGRYKFLCKGLRVSIPDSSCEIHVVSVMPTTDDEGFFELKKTRSTRFIISASQFKSAGVDFIGALDGKQYVARSMLVDSLHIDVYMNKDKDYDKHAAKPRMPNQIFALVPGRLQIDSIDFSNAQFDYAERAFKGARSAAVFIDEINMNIVGVTNVPTPATAMVIHALGRIQKSGLLKTRITIPTASVGLAMHISGSLSAMPLSKFNTFLEVAEHIRISTGQLQHATMNISVSKGRSTGRVKAVYTDLYITSLDEKTNKDSGLMNSIKMFLSNLFVFNGSNTRDSDGKIEPGLVNYVHKPNDEFMEIVWFSVRSGIGDIVGF